MTDNMNELRPEELEDVAGGVAGKELITYVVGKGDNLTKIAHRYGVTVKELVRWNKIPDPNLILVGQRLKIYV